jgi:hypothetical protein
LDFNILKLVRNLKRSDNAAGIWLFSGENTSPDNPSAGNEISPLLLIPKTAGCRFFVEFFADQ